MLSGWVSRSRAWRICSTVMAGDRPRRTPRALATSSPSRVPSKFIRELIGYGPGKLWRPDVLISAYYLWGNA